ncbi:hypothetical protein Bbelb_304300 [Branchiostoma belcheri]|nr:hypothetical protein Bbelb_304300 [Branchiostoma belcheri]
MEGRLQDSQTLNLPTAPTSDRSEHQGKDHNAHQMTARKRSGCSHPKEQVNCKKHPQRKQLVSSRALLSTNKCTLCGSSPFLIDLKHLAPTENTQPESHVERRNGFPPKFRQAMLQAEKAEIYTK